MYVVEMHLFTRNIVLASFISFYAWSALCFLFILKLLKMLNFGESFYIFIPSTCIFLLRLKFKYYQVFMKGLNLNYTIILPGMIQGLEVAGDFTCKTWYNII